MHSIKLLNLEWLIVSVGFLHNVSEIADLDSLAHALKAGGKLLNEIHFNVKVDWQIGVLVCGVDRATDVEVDIGGFFKQQPTNQ